VGRCIRVVARLLLGLATLFVGALLVLVAVGGAGVTRDSLECGGLPPPADSGVSEDAIVRVAPDLRLFPLGVRCLYEGPQGQTIVVSDITFWHTLALAFGGLLMVLGICLPFLRRRRQPQA